MAVRRNSHFCLSRNIIPEPPCFCYRLKVIVGSLGFISCAQGLDEMLTCDSGLRTGVVSVCSGILLAELSCSQMVC